MCDSLASRKYPWKLYLLLVTLPNTQVSNEARLEVLMTMKIQAMVFLGFDTVY
jgi:hypothetical protein